MKPVPPAPFDDDVRSHQGYRYTTNASLSSRLANQRLTELTRQLVVFTNRTVIDIGCGDGTYTQQLFRQEEPASMLGVDASRAAIEIARRRYESARLRFEVCDVACLAELPRRFDVALVRGVLHHVNDAPRALQQICRVAGEVVVIEPNGYNPVLKLIERLSRYHREHGERSYAPPKLRSWIRACDARIDAERYAGLVPFFCPDWMARALKRSEPVVEHLPLLRQVACAVYALRFRVESRSSRPRWAPLQARAAPAQLPGAVPLAKSPP